MEYLYRDCNGIPLLLIPKLLPENFFRCTPFPPAVQMIETPLRDRTDLAIDPEHQCSAFRVCDVEG